MDALKRESGVAGSSLLCPPTTPPPVPPTTPPPNNNNNSSSTPPPSLFSSDRRVRYASLCGNPVVCSQQKKREKPKADSAPELFTFSNGRRCVTFSRSSVAAFFRDQ